MTARPHDPDQATRLGPLPRLATTVYTGKIWGGVQITDSAVKDLMDDLLLSFPEGGYDGLYADAAALELLAVEPLLVEVE